MVTYQKYQQERENQARLKAEIDRICHEIVGGRVRDEDELAVRIERARELCRELFPERAELFELVYQSRLQRLWEQFGRAPE